MRVQQPSKSHRKAVQTVKVLEKAIRQVVGPAWYGTDEAHPLEKVVGDVFRRRRATLAVAESCTGGLLASRLTDIAGSSDFFLQGYVTYTDSAKTRDLGVPQQKLKRHGAVSREVAVAMAAGVRQKSGATWGVGITGIAGPGGGTSQKPVGLVYVALSSKSRSFCSRHQFSGGRLAVRSRAVLAALDHLRRI